MNVVRLACAVDNRAVVLGNLDFLGLAQILEGGLLQRQSNLLGDNRTAGQDSQVFQHGLATITKARRLDCRHLDDAADGVDYQRGQGLAFNIFGHDHQRTT